MAAPNENVNKPFLEQPALHTRAKHRAALLTHPGNFNAAVQEAMADPKKTLFGAAHGIPSTFVTKTIAMAKPDFIWIDYEHGVFDRLGLYDAIQAAQHHSEGHSLVVVRVAHGDIVGLSTALDAGASGIVMPHTETAEDVRKMIKDVYYPPLGQRSFSPWTFTPGVHDASLYEDDGFNMINSNKHIALIAQIESVKGLENIDEIASVPGVSGLMFGPGDFSADAGIKLRLGGQPPQEFIEAMTKFVEGAKRNNKPLFGAAQAPAQIPMMIGQGYAAIAVAFDMWGLAGLVADGIKGAREIVNNMDKGEANGEEANGKATNGSADKTVAVNGKESS